MIQQEIGKVISNGEISEGTIEAIKRTLDEMDARFNLE